MKFQIVKKVDLSDIGEGWDGCYIKMNSISMKEAREMAKLNVTENSDLSEQEEATNFMIELLKGKFIEGMGWNGTKKVKILAEDFDELPPQVMAKVLAEFTTGLTPNA